MFRLLSLVLALCAIKADGKVVDSVARLSSKDTEQFLAKFSFSPGVAGTIEGVFAVEDVPGHKHREYFDQMPHALKIALFSDDAWSKFNEMMKKGSLCKDRLSVASFVKDIGGGVKGGQERFTFSHKIAFQERSHFWYAMIVDCYLEEYNALPPPIRFVLTFLNGENHLPADEAGMDTFLFFLMWPALAFGIFYGMHVKRQLVASGQIHLVVLVLGAAFLLQFGAIFSEWAHLRKYRNDGKGLRWRHTWLALDFVAELLQGESEIVVSCLLVFLAFGWTVLPPVRQQRNWRDPASYMRGIFSRVTLESLYFCASMFFVQTCLELASRGYDEDFNSFHDHEHLPGYLFVLLRTALGVLFLWGTTSTLKHSPPDEDSVVFLHRLRVLGTCWFMTFPLLVMLATLIPPTSRHSVVMGTTILLQVVACGLLSSMFFSRGGKYFKISSLSRIGKALPITSFSSPSSFSASIGGKLNLD